MPRKNILDMAGKLLITRTKITALQSKYIDETMVTIDNSEIAKISKKYGVQIPFLRPLELSGDMANSFDVVEHVIGFYEKRLNAKFQGLNH